MWDPASGGWVTEEELAGSPVPAPAEGAAPVEPAEPSAPRPPVGEPERPRAAPPRLVTPLVAGAAGAALAIAAFLLVPGLRSADDAPRPGATGAAGLDAAAIADEVRAAVVNITTETGAGGEEPSMRAGSGIVLEPDGIIATSAQLVGDADVVRVTFSSGLAVDGEVLASDPITEVAIVDVAENDLPTVETGSVEFLRPGTPVVALASPTETYGVVSEGVVASVGQPIRTEDDTLLLDMIQVDAPLPVSGSGGVVLADGATAVGMTSAAAEGSGAAGYFVPMDIVLSVAEQVVAGRDIAHPFLGAITTPVDSSTGLPVDGQGLVVAIVINNSPAAEAGIEPADMIVGIDQERIGGPHSLLAALVGRRPGEEIVLSVISDGELEDVTVAVGERPREIR